MKKIAIFISDKIPALRQPNEPENLLPAWQGTNDDLNIKSESDAEILEDVYYIFNSEDKRPPLDFNLHTFSAGDVVQIDEKKYRCLNLGWEEVN